MDPELEIYNYTLSENPADSGDTVTLTVHLRNIEFGACADTISVQAMTAYPLSVSGLDTQYMDSLCLGDPVSEGPCLSFFRWIRSRSRVPTRSR